MYINQVIYETFIPDWIETSSIGDRVKKYFKDLYARYKTHLNMDLSGKAYSYDDLGRLLFNDLKENDLLANADLIVFPSWSFSWDMKYAVPELVWKKQYDFHAQLLDVRDCGLLCVFRAIHITLKHYGANTLNQGLCCSIENAWLPMPNEKVQAPEINYISSIAHSKHLHQNSGLKILCAEIVASYDCLTNIQKIMREFRVPENHCAFYLNENSGFEHYFDDKAVF